ncbi:hypothetical protein LTR50_000033 [Elasticomyces elasticus]|nr:hypothetical protein LTR50_000033 [Elasticomyces elasticus]
MYRTFTDVNLVARENYCANPEVVTTPTQSLLATPTHSRSSVADRGTLVMAVHPAALNLFGLILLFHAVYSAYEHALLPLTTSHPPLSSSSTLLSSLNPRIDLPADITLETILAVLILCFGIVSGSPELRPVEWAEWAGKLEREKQDLTDAAAGAGGGMGRNPYRGLDERVGFLDIRGARREFAAWVREGGGGAS